MWPAIAAIGDDAGKAGADLRLDLSEDRRQRVAMNWPPLE